MLRLPPYFNPRPPRGERPCNTGRWCGRWSISIHALREESDSGISLGIPPLVNFNPRPPRGERLTRQTWYRIAEQFQSTPSARRATASVLTGKFFHLISIHALREESDRAFFVLIRHEFQFQSTPSARRATSGAREQLYQILYFNPRPPRGERRTKHGTSETRPKFQSTPSARRATWLFCFLPGCHRNFNPRPPRGERRVYNHIENSVAIFQSTPSARRATLTCCSRSSRACDFNPRPPRGERRWHPRRCFDFPHISIHALREESDRRGRGTRRRSDNFNPRPPRGERLAQRRVVRADEEFQSTPSARRATARHAFRAFAERISIHALREESDLVASGVNFAMMYFNPRPPRGERLMCRNSLKRLSIFQSTPSARRATSGSVMTSLSGRFQSTPSARRATLAVEPGLIRWEFQSTPSARRATGQAQILTYGVIN